MFRRKWVSIIMSSGVVKLMVVVLGNGSRCKVMNIEIIVDKLMIVCSRCLVGFWVWNEIFSFCCNVIIIRIGNRLKKLWVNISFLIGICLVVIFSVVIIVKNVKVDVSLRLIFSKGVLWVMLVGVGGLEKWLVIWFDGMW